jgi:hypothetical protein
VVAAPLVIDLDGTLLRSDLLMETGIEFVRHYPCRLLTPLVWLAGGKATLKKKLACATDLDVSVLPYDNAVLDLILGERQRGRRIVLATASHRLLAERVAAHLSLFDEIIATDEGLNLSAHAKRDVLVRAYGEKGFDYAGNSLDDVPIWRAARHSYVVSASRFVERRAVKLGNVKKVIRPDGGAAGDWIKAFRVHQWVKNFLLFVPLLAAHRYTEWPLVLDALIAFLCFGLCASSVYVLNDLVDLGVDQAPPAQAHPAVRSRTAFDRVGPVRGAATARRVVRACAVAVAARLQRGTSDLFRVDAGVLTVAQAAHGHRRHDAGDSVYAARDHRCTGTRDRLDLLAPRVLYVHILEFGAGQALCGAAPVATCRALVQKARGRGYFLG